MEFALQQPASDLQLPKESYVGQRSRIGDSTFTVSLAAMMMPRERPAAGLALWSICFSLTK
jgi:hypothetical protein